VFRPPASQTVERRGVSCLGEETITLPFPRLPLLFSCPPLFAPSPPLSVSPQAPHFWHFLLRAIYFFFLFLLSLVHQPTFLRTPLFLAAPPPLSSMPPCPSTLRVNASFFSFFFPPTPSSLTGGTAKGTLVPPSPKQTSNIGHGTGVTRGAFLSSILFVPPQPQDGWIVSHVKSFGHC